MSISVDVDALREAMAGRQQCYLLTVADDGRPHAVAVRPELVNARFAVGTGQKSSAYAAARPAVSLVWPPNEAGGYTLIADGTATVSGQSVQIDLTRAVLHRAGSPAGGESRSDDVACISDCVPLVRQPNP